MAQTMRASGPAAFEGGGFLASIAAALRDWRERRRLAAEIDEIAASGELEPFLADAGLNRAQLPTLLRGSGGARRLLDAMMARIGVDLAAAPAAIRRDVEWTCAACTEHRACKRWLRAETASGYAAFCPNAPVFKRLLRAAAATGADRT